MSAELTSGFKAFKIVFKKEKTAGFLSRLIPFPAKKFCAEYKWYALIGANSPKTDIKIMLRMAEHTLFFGENFSVKAEYRLNALKCRLDGAEIYSEYNLTFWVQNALTGVFTAFTAKR